MNDGDILSELESIAARLISPDVAAAVVAELRQRWGGDRVYIRGIDRQGRDKKIIAALQQGGPSVRVAHQVGTSAATVRRVRQRLTLE